MKRIVNIFIFIVAVSFSLNCYADEDYSRFEKETGFVVKEVNAYYSGDDIRDFKVYSCDRNGIVVYVNSEYNPRYIFIDYNGNVTECGTYSLRDNYSHFSTPIIFNCGMARIRFDNYKYGYINEDYKWVVPPIYSAATDFSNGFAAVILNDKAYLINNSGKVCMSVDEFLYPEFCVQKFKIIFSNGYAAYLKDGVMYYLDENLNSTKTDIGDNSNHEYSTYFFEGGTLVYAYGEWLNEKYYVGYRILNHKGKVSYEYKLNVPRDVVDSLSEFLNILPNGVVLFEEPENYEDFESKAKHISVSISGEELGETVEINNVCSKLFVRGIYDKVINLPNIYNTNLNNISIIDWETNRDYDFYSSDGDVFGNIIVSKNYEKSSAKIEKIRLIMGKNTELKREIKIVDQVRIPEIKPEISGTISVYLNNKQIDFDTNPIIESDRTLVPMRAIFEALGAEVKWYDETNTATAVKDDVTVSVTIDGDTMLKNGESITLDVPARLIDDSRTFIPLRAVSEAFGCTVNWSEELQRVDILSDE